MHGNGELTGTETGTETLFLRKLRSSYGILKEERNYFATETAERHGNVNLETRRYFSALRQ